LKVGWSAPLIDIPDIQGSGIYLHGDAQLERGSSSPAGAFAQILQIPATHKELITPLARKTNRSKPGTKGCLSHKQDFIAHPFLGKTFCLRQP